MISWAPSPSVSATIMLCAPSFAYIVFWLLSAVHTRVKALSRQFQALIAAREYRPRAIMMLGRPLAGSPGF